MEEHFILSKLSIDDSYVNQFHQAGDQLFTNYPYKIQVRDVQNSTYTGTHVR